MTRVLRLLEKASITLPYVLVVFFSGLLMAGSFFRFFDVYEYQTYDWRFQLNPPVPISDDILIIEIDDESLYLIGQWPFDRVLHATLINILERYRARMIGIDILFAEPSRGVSDDELARSSKDFGNAYFPLALQTPVSDGNMLKSDDIVVPLLETISNSARGIGHVTAKVDEDGTRRRVPLTIMHGGIRYMQFAFRMAIDYLNISEDEVEINEKGNLKVGRHMELPLDDKGYLLIPFAGRWGTFKHTSLAEILHANTLVMRGQESAFDLNMLRDKVCFYGLTATGTHDINPVPIEEMYAQVGVHANIFNSIVNNKFVNRLSRFWNLLIFVVLAFIALGLTRIPKLGLSVSAAALTILVYSVSVVVIFYFYLIWIDLFYPTTAFVVIYLTGIVRRSMSEKRRRELLEAELTIASRIQQSFLPAKLPDSKILDIAATMMPAKHVGGDLYSFVEIQIGFGNIGIMLGDVSGKGMPAALFMAKSVAEFKFCSANISDPSKVLKHLNESLSSEDASGLFVTMNYAVFDTERKKMILSNGGHMPVLNIDAWGNVKHLSPEGGMPLALMPGVEFCNIESDLKEGDIFVFYTDGISEARNKACVDYEIDRLTEMARLLRSQSAEDIKKGIIEDIARFVGKAPQHDDTTLIVVKVRPS